MRTLALLTVTILAAAPALADGDGPRRAAPDRGERVVRSFDTHHIPADLGPRRRTELDIQVDGSRMERDGPRRPGRPIGRPRTDGR